MYMLPLIPAVEPYGTDETSALSNTLLPQSYFFPSIMKFSGAMRDYKALKQWYHKQEMRFSIFELSESSKKDLVAN
jgi:hypothetical protein